MIDVEVVVEGFDALVAHLDTMATEIAAPLAAWAAIYADFLLLEAWKFDTEGPDWAPLADSTIVSKRRAGYPDTILEATRKLRDSLDTAGASGAIHTITPTGLTMGTDYRSDRQTGAWADTALAAFHQQGTRNMPARPVIEMTAMTIEEWVSLVAHYLGGGAAPVPITF